MHRREKGRKKKDKQKQERVSDAIKDVPCPEHQQRFGLKDAVWSCLTGTANWKCTGDALYMHPLLDSPATPPHQTHTLTFVRWHTHAYLFILAHKDGGKCPINYR